MDGLLHAVMPFLLGAVVVVLLMGLANMLRGGNPGRSQRLMRWRVGLQFIAIVVVVAIVYFTR